MEPTFPRAHMISQAFVEKGMFTEALAEAEKWRHSDCSPVWELQASVYARAGQPEHARSALAKWEQWQRTHQGPVTFGPLLAYIALGRKDDAIATLEKSYTEHTNVLIEIRVAPYCDPMRSDPRFQDLLRRIHLAE